LVRRSDEANRVRLLEEREAREAERVLNHRRADHPPESDVSDDAA
jgi:hypothetical protein